MLYTHSSSSLLRTLQLGKSWFPEQQGSGLDRMYYGLSRWLPTTGVAFDGLIAGTPPERQVPSVHPFAADTASLTERLLGVRRSVRRHLVDTPTDLIVSHFALYTVPALDLLDSRPMVVHFHGPWAQESAVEGERSWAVRAKHYVETATYRRADQFIVLSEAFRNILCTLYDVDPDRVQVVPGGSRCPATHCRERPPGPSACGTDRRPGTARPRTTSGLRPRRQPSLCVSRRHRLGRSHPLPGRLRAHHGGVDGRRAPRPGDPQRGPAGGRLRPFPGPGPRRAPQAALTNRLIEILRGRLTLPSAAACQAYARARFDWPVIAAQTRDVYTKALSLLPA